MSPSDQNNLHLFDCTVVFKSLFKIVFWKGNNERNIDNIMHFFSSDRSIKNCVNPATCHTAPYNYKKMDSNVFVSCFYHRLDLHMLSFIRTQHLNGLNDVLKRKVLWEPVIANCKLVLHCSKSFLFLLDLHMLTFQTMQHLNGLNMSNKVLK